MLLLTFILGVGTGMTMPSVLMQVQNGAERRDVGSATGCLLFLRSMGGAFGSTVAGALLAQRFNAGLLAAGVAEPVDLGSLRHGAGGLAALGEAGLAAARTALESGFQLGFGVCAATTVVALVLSAGHAGCPAAVGCRRAEGVGALDRDRPDWNQSGLESLSQTRRDTKRPDAVRTIWV